MEGIDGDSEEDLRAPVRLRRRIEVLAGKAL